MLRCLSEKFYCFIDVLRQFSSIVVENANLILCRSIPLIGSLAIPLKGFGIVFRKSLSYLIETSKHCLRFRVTLFCQRPNLFIGFRIVTFRKSFYTVLNSCHCLQGRQSN